MRILLIENEGDLMDQILNEMARHYVVDVAYSSEGGGYLSEVNDYDAVIVGPTLFGSEGTELCKITRTINPNIPIAIIPMKNNSEERVVALNSGADVCINYPVNGNELNAQIGALIRRSSHNPNSIINIGSISLDYYKKTVRVKGSLIFLRKKEYELLEYLFINRGSVVTKEKILEHVWDEGIYIFSNTVEVHVRNLRLALKKHKVKNIFKTIRGFGYMVKA